jgi:hypothetical protein
VSRPTALALEKGVGGKVVSPRRSKSGREASYARWASAGTFWGANPTNEVSAVDVYSG